MTLEEAAAILGELPTPDGDLEWVAHRGDLGYVDYHAGSRSVTLDADFTIDELEAILVWMKAHVK